MTDCTANSPIGSQSVHHLVITGTGRAGTSFLVQYLHANGFDTHLSRYPEATLDVAANAGLEDYLMSAHVGSYPYVVKSPWIALNPEAAIPPEVTVDAFIVPVRALDEAAASRVILERAAMHRAAPWMADQPESFHHWGTVAGGMVYALNTEDQARILAVGFHNLVQYAVRRDIPLVFLDFPRFIEDGDYLVSRLATVLPMERERALAAHAALSDRSLVRTGDELRAAGADGPLPAAAADRLAMGRELTAARRQLAQTQQRLQDAEARDTSAAAYEEARRVQQESDAFRQVMGTQVEAARQREEELAARLTQAERQIRDMGASPGAPVDTSLRGLLRQWRRARRSRRRG